VDLVGLDRRSEAGLLAFGEPFLGAAQQVPDLVKRVFAAAPVPGEGLLKTPADFVDGLAARLDDVERVEHRGGVVQLVVEAFL
jgi:hypothetical protein